MRGVHRQFAITFRAAQIRSAVVSPATAAITAADGGFTYDSREKNGTSQGLPGRAGPEHVYTSTTTGTHRGAADIALPLSILTTTTQGASQQVARIAGDNEGLLGVLANLESNYDVSVNSSGAYWCAIGNSNNGSALPPTIGEGVVGSLGSAHGVADGSVNAGTQFRGFIRGVPVSTFNQAQLTSVARSIRAMCLEIESSTELNARREARNGVARILFL